MNWNDTIQTIAIGAGALLGLIVLVAMMTCPLWIDLLAEHQKQKLKTPPPSVILPPSPGFISRLAWSLWTALLTAGAVLVVMRYGRGL